VGRPWGDTVTGLLTARGNPTRTFYGVGPVPRSEAGPVATWRFPRSGGMCGFLEDEWSCGTGFPGQPTVFERGGRTWLVFGAFDNALHFLDADTGERIIPDFRATGNRVTKGGVTIDPDGYPLAYVGFFDHYFRIISFDQDRPVELFRLDATANSQRRWTTLWDSAPLIIDDYLFVGGENSWFYIFKLNRTYDGEGHVRVAPEEVWRQPSWDAELERTFGRGAPYSIEGAPAIFKDTLYFANSVGLVQGFDISGLKQGRDPERVFRFWTGDDTDAAMVVDEEGYLYVGSQDERHNARSREVGQMMKLDPSKPNDPVVWSRRDENQTVPCDSPNGCRGVWGAPALYQDVVIFPLVGGDVVALDRETGEQRWQIFTPGGKTWQPPVVVDGVMIIGDCTGRLHGYDVARTGAAPVKLWTIRAGGCVESTPAVWKGRIYLGTRSGTLVAWEERDPPATPTPSG
jgi:outer membrane protein assembly factor BamB